ncbi:MAG: DMT family transporter [Methylophilaceae bacterium]
MAYPLAAWLFLIASILFEVFGMLSLKHSNGFDNLFPTASAISCFITSIWLMSISLKQIEMGITYAVWAAASTAIVAVLGVIFYAEIVTTYKMIGITLIVVGVILLNLSS